MPFAERCFGTGPVEWLLLPGILGSPLEWERLGSPDGRGALAVSLPGGDRLETMARSLLPRLGRVGPVVVVGASLGGLVGAALACLRPDQVRALVCVGTLGDPVLVPRRVRLGAVLARHLPDRIWDRLYRQRLARELENQHLPQAHSAALMSAAPSRQTWADRVTAVSRWGLPARLPVPVVVLAGRGSPWPQSQVFGREPTVVAGSHRPHIDAPDALRVAILDGVSAVQSGRCDVEGRGPVVAAGRPFS
jgi:pimeloyl-ACP methyl ester carboxylesterase